jgi:phosphatidylglycerophosphatase A
LREIHLKSLIIWLASVSYAGFSPRIPGTVGTLVGVLIYFLVYPFPAPLYWVSTASLFALACWVSARAEIIFGQRDSPRIVIDEVVGYLVAMAFLPQTITTVASGFLFFRIFDIIKLFPAGRINRWKGGGLAVVLDDVIAGLYTNILLRVVILGRPEFLFFLDR